MEKLVNLYDKEHMKLAMLKHEEVFREQVFELHRLYQIQKMLTQNIKRARRKNEDQPTWNFKKCEDKIQGLDLERPAEEEFNNNMGNNGHKIEKMVDESELLELTLGPSKNFYRRRKVVDAPLSLLQSDNHSGTSLSSSSSSNNNRQRHHQQKMNTARQENNSQKWRVDNHVTKKSNHHSFLGEMRNEVNNVVGEENLIQDRSLNNNPPWLFQALSLKMT